MEDPQRAFLLKEYDKLSAEVAKLLEETRTRERYSLAVVAAIAAWIYTEALKPPKDNLKPNIHLIHLLGYVPLVIAVLLGFSVLFLYLNIVWIGSYLRRIEIEIFDFRGETSTWGWERNFDRYNRRRFFVIWSCAYWILQVVIGVVILCKSHSMV